MPPPLPDQKYITFNYGKCIRINLEYKTGGKIFPVHLSYQVDLFFVSKVLTAPQWVGRWLAAPLHGFLFQFQEEVGVAHLPCQAVQTFLV